MRQLHAISPVRSWLVLLLLLLAAQQLAGAGLIKAKAWLAPLLIERAWSESLQYGGLQVKPWPWADTWPVARLRLPTLDIDLLVLAGDSGNALAFGPGHTLASAPLGSAGLAVIGGHRDTHFAFLRELSNNERLLLDLPDGSQREYRVESASIVDANRTQLSAAVADEALLLVTCYPFDTLRTNGPLRFVVRATPVAAVPRSETGPAIIASLP